MSQLPATPIQPTRNPTVSGSGSGSGSGSAAPASIAADDITVATPSPPTMHFLPRPSPPTLRVNTLIAPRLAPAMEKDRKAGVGAGPRLLNATAPSRPGLHLASSVPAPLLAARSTAQKKPLGTPSTPSSPALSPRASPLPRRVHLPYHPAPWTAEEVDHRDRVRRRIADAVAADQQATTVVTQPMVDAPWATWVDAAKALLPYHVWQYAEEDLERNRMRQRDLQVSMRIQENGDRMAGRMADRLGSPDTPLMPAALLDEMEKRDRAVEEVLIATLILEAEREDVKELRESEKDALE